MEGWGYGVPFQRADQPMVDRANRKAIHCYTGLSGFQKGILMFHVVGVDGVFRSEDGPRKRND